MEIIFVVIGIIFIYCSFKFMVEEIDCILHGAKGATLRRNLTKEEPKKYGSELSIMEKLFKILLVLVFGIAYTSGGLFFIYAAISNTFNILNR